MTSSILKKTEYKEIENVFDEETKSPGDKLVFPDFDDIKVSTKTFIVNTNMTLDIDKVYNYLPITDYIVIPKRRGRKKKIEQVDPNKDIPNGSIITLEYQSQLRGVDLKKKKKKDTKKRGNYFRNSVTIVMVIDNKKINFKVSRNGKFQMTGCKSNDQAEACVKWFWTYIKDSEGIYNIDSGVDSGVDSDIDSDIDSETINKKIPKLKIIFVPAMRNIDFGLGFFVDREKLDEYFNMMTEHNSLLETSFGYTGVNIKIPIDKNIRELRLKKIEYVNGKWKKPVYVPYEDYLDMLPEKDVEKKLNKKRYNTFLIFHSGKVIMSGMEATFMKETYYKFLDIIRECYDVIEERLEY